MFLAEMGLCCCTWAFSSCSAWTLIVVAFLVAEHVLLGTWASVVVVYGLNCPASCGIFPDQVLNLCFLHWLVDFLPWDHQGSPV